MEPYRDDEFEQDEDAAVPSVPPPRRPTTAAEGDTSLTHGPSDARRDGPHAPSARQSHAQDEGYYDGSAVSHIRETEEYRAAWDVEVWKAIQVSRFQVEFKDTKRKQMEAWKQSLADKEREALAKVDRQARELLTRERRIVEEEKLLERRRQKLSESEKEMRVLRQQLADHRQQLDIEADIRVQRVKDDMTHRSEMAHQKLTQAEEVARRAEERLQSSQTEYINLFEEFSNFKTRQLANPDAQVVRQLEQMRTEHTSEMASLQDRLERRHQEQVLTLTHRCHQLEDQVTRLSSSLASKKQLCRSQQTEVTRLETLLKATQAELDQLRIAHQTLESRLELATRRNDEAHRQHLSAVQTHRPKDGPMTPSTAATGHTPIQQMQATVRSVAAMEDKRRVNISAAHHDASRSNPSIAFSDEQTQLLREIQRLEDARRGLLEDTGGVYDHHSPLVQQLNDRLLTLRGRCVLPIPAAAAADDDRRAAVPMRHSR